MSRWIWIRVTCDCNDCDNDDGCGYVDENWDVLSDTSKMLMILKMLIKLMQEEVEVPSVKIHNN